MPEAFDAVIVGGGPAGSTCAWKLRQAGLNVLVLDKAEFPRTKLCAGWVTPQVVADLELDPLEYPHGFLSFRRLEFNWRGLKLRKKTVQHSIRRFELDHWLLQRSGAEVVRHKVRHIARQDGKFVIDDAWSCDWLIGAGGTGCPVYRELFSGDNPRAKDLQIATFEHELRYDWHDEECRLWFFEHGLPGYAWYVPKAGGWLNVGLGGKADGIKDQSLKLRDHWERLVGKLDEMGLVSGADYDPSGYSYYLRGRAEAVRSGNAFIVGDAVGLASVDMGEGIGPAVRSALLAAAAITDGADYDLRSLGRFSIPGFFSRSITRKAA